MNPAAYYCDGRIPCLTGFGCRSGSTIADRSEFGRARFEEDKTDRKVLRGTHRKRACEGYTIDYLERMK